MSKVSLKLVAANLTLRLSTESAQSDKAIIGHFYVPGTDCNLELSA